MHRYRPVAVHLDVGETNERQPLCGQLAAGGGEVAQGGMPHAYTRDDAFVTCLRCLKQSGRFEFLRRTPDQRAATDCARYLAYAQDYSRKRDVNVRNVAMALAASLRLPQPEQIRVRTELVRCVEAATGRIPRRPHRELLRDSLRVLAMEVIQRFELLVDESDDAVVSKAVEQAILEAELEAAIARGQ